MLKPGAIEKLGVFAFLDAMSAAEAAAFAARLETWGYSVAWLPEAVGRNVLSFSAFILARTEKLIVATGIANIYARDAQAMAAARQGLAEQSGGRFLLGMGVSHAPLVASLRGHDYGKPIATMRAYLDAMARAVYRAPPPAEPVPTVLAALGPKMLALSAERADGAHPYNVTPEHTAEARGILGPGKLLCVEQKVLLETDPARARAVGRKALSMYMSLENYVNNWRRLGFGDDDLAGGGSDRFIDAMVAWGDENAIRRRIQAHRDAGADHVCVQPLVPEGKPGFVDEAVLALLAPGG